VFDLFKKKKSKISIVPPPPPGNLPSFPSPEELDDFIRKDKSDTDSMDLPELPDLPEPPLPGVISNMKFAPPKSTSPRSMSTLKSRSTGNFSEEIRTRPVFLKADLFQAVLNDIGNVRTRLEKSNRMIARLEEVHDNQNHLLHNWQSTLKDFHEKLLFVDSILFKKG